MLRNSRGPRGMVPRGDSALKQRHTLTDGEMPGLRASVGRTSAGETRI